MSDQVSHSGRDISIGDTHHKLRYPIQKTLQFDELVVVLLSPPSNTEVRDNIVAFDLDGCKKWTIDPVSTKERSGSLVYVDIMESEGKLLAQNWNEAAYEVDTEDGSIEFYKSGRSR